MEGAREAVVALCVHPRYGFTVQRNGTRLASGTRFSAVLQVSSRYGGRAMRQYRTYVRLMRHSARMGDRAKAGLGKTIPALPVRDVTAAVAHYRERFGFEPVHEDAGFAVLARDDAVLHLWEASDEEWRSRDDLAARPVCSGAESFLAGTASCRIETADPDALFEELGPKSVLHPTVTHVADTDFGTREFATVDLDGNLLTFYRWRNA